MTSNSASCALLSVSDKTDIVQFATALSEAGVKLLSTGGTAKALSDAGLDVTDVASHTGAAEMMGGRVKTLHPVVHGGILGRRGIDDAVMQKRDIAPIDYVVVNLYPFAQTVAKDDVSFEDAIENIDIGGPAMLRSAAKNHASVSVVTNPDDYQRVIDALDASDADKRALRFDLAIKAYEHTARYDGMIASFFGSLKQHGVTADRNAFPRTLNLQLVLAEPLRYGENPHQRAALYKEHKPEEGTLAASSLLQGKAMSYNNMMDADAALACVSQFEKTACVIVKHANPCGVSLATSQLDAYQHAFKTDKTSAFGGIIAFNTPLEKATAAAITEQQFVEVIIAPGISDDALPVLEKYKNVRVLNCHSISARANALQFKPISGGMLVQDDDLHELTESDISVVSEQQPSADEMSDLVFAWNVAKHVKSNAIVYCKDHCTVGVGAGQMSRVNSARIAGIKAEHAGLEVPGSVMASDAFFPFRDGIDNAANAGIKAVIQPGGSMRDDEVIAAANEAGIAMVFTGMRHFRH